MLTHEAGHAFQCYLSERLIPVSALQSSTSEINEIHSMAMEFFTYPWMDKFFGDRADEYRYAHLCGALSVIPYMASVSYTHLDVYKRQIYKRSIAAVSKMPGLYCLRYRNQPPENRKAEKLNLPRLYVFMFLNTAI